MNNETKTFKPQYQNCLLLCFEDHNYYDDSDSWTVFYDGNKHEVVEEYWTTRGACQGCNANPHDIQFNFDNCPEALMKEVIEYLRNDLLNNFNFEELAKNTFVPQYKYQAESAQACIKEFLEVAPKAVAKIDNIWLLCKFSNKVHTYTDFAYRFKRNYDGPLLNSLIMAEMTLKMEPVRKRTKPVYGTKYEGKVLSVRHQEGGYYPQPTTIAIVSVDGFGKPFYLKFSGYKSIDAGSNISFAGIINEKAGDKYIFINKLRKIEEGDILSWH